MSDWVMEKALGPRLAVIVTTVDAEGHVNAAPVTWHSPISYEPPIVSISLKPWTHTLANIRETGEFVLNQMMPEHVGQVCICAVRFGKEVNELREARLASADVAGAIVPRVNSCENWLFCKMISELAIGDHVVVFGLVEKAELTESCFAGVLYREKRDFALVGSTLLGAD